MYPFDASHATPRLFTLKFLPLSSTFSRFSAIPFKCFICFLIRVMSVVYDANNFHMAKGSPGISFDEFYNDAINEQFDYRQDYRNWRFDP